MYTAWEVKVWQNQPQIPVYLTIYTPGITTTLEYLDAAWLSDLSGGLDPPDTADIEHSPGSHQD